MAASGAGIVITGFMATGKTEVGALVAQRLGMPFVDLDRWIEATSGHSIPEIFAREGESGFRRRESEALRVLADGEAGPELVLATGGGTLVHGRSEKLRLLRRLGPIVNLSAKPRTVLRRLRASGEIASRPLLAQAAAPERTVRDLLDARAEAYAAADLQMPTDGLPPRRVADEVIARAGRAAVVDDNIRVELGERSYPVRAAEGLKGLRQALEARWGRRRIALLIDGRVDKLWGEAVRKELRPESVHIVAPGERSKALSRAGRLFDALLEAGHDRESAIVAVGGGVTGDLAGFVAACFLRGIRWAQVPTTLLAQVDSAVGGKTGVNVSGPHGGKNLVGAFHQPSLVYAPASMLSTLPERDYRAGLAEVVKYGVIGDAGLFAFLEAERAAVLAREPAAVATILRRSLAQKAHVVAQDEREGGLRRILNFGHTVGHALESEAASERSSKKRLLHGEAVSLGMSAAARISVALGHCESSVETRVRELLTGLSLPVAWEARGDLKAALTRLSRDKKAVRQGRGATRIHFILAERIGRVRVEALTPARIESALLRPAARKAQSSRARASQAAGRSRQRRKS